jgi:hypothetical protein
MATLVESADIETLSSSSNVMASPMSASLSHRFVDNKFYLLVVIGEMVTEDHLKCAIADIEKGKKIEGWDPITILRMWGRLAYDGSGSNNMLCHRLQLYSYLIWNIVRRTSLGLHHAPSLDPCFCNLGYFTHDTI